MTPNLARASRGARCGARLARPAPAPRASSRLVAAALRAPPVPASPSTGLRTAGCTFRRIGVSARARAPAERMRTSLRIPPDSRVRTSADSAAGAAAAVPRTAPCSTRCASCRSSAATAPIRRLRRRRFPMTFAVGFRPSRPPGRPWILTPDAPMVPFPPAPAIA